MNHTAYVKVYENEVSIKRMRKPGNQLVNYHHRNEIELTPEQWNYIVERVENEWVPITERIDAAKANDELGAHQWAHAEADEVLRDIAKKVQVMR